MKTLYILLLTFLGAATTIQGQTQTFSNTTEVIVPEGMTFSVPKFNTAIGTLISADITVTISNSGKSNSIRTENLAATSQASTARKNLEWEVELLNTMSGSLVESFPYTNINTLSRTSPAYDGVLDFAGTSGFAKTDNAVDVTYNNPGDVNQFTGTTGETADVLAITYFDHATSITGGGGNIQTSFSSAYDVTVSVTYTYSSTLPVKLVSFAGNYVDVNNVDLKWKTSFEENIESFNVQYSQDGRSFETIATVNSRGGFTETNYSYTHHKNFSLNPLAFYRLRSVETDGRFDYSNIIRLDMKNNNPSSYLIYPNPASKETGTVNISGKTSSGTYSVYAMDGKLMISKFHSLPGTVLSLDVQSLQKGNYLVKTPDNKTVKFILQ